MYVMCQSRYKNCCQVAYVVMMCLRDNENIRNDCINGRLHLDEALIVRLKISAKRNY